MLGKSKIQVALHLSFAGNPQHRPGKALLALLTLTSHFSIYFFFLCQKANFFLLKEELGNFIMANNYSCKELQNKKQYRNK